MTTDNTTPDQFVQDELKLSMYVPADAAGKIIGKRGIVVTNLKRETQASFITALKPVGGSLWTAVIVLGTLESVSATYDAIANIVDNEVDDVILEFTFNRFKQHSFLAAGGNPNHIIRKLSAETSVRIYIPGVQTSPQTATLEGSFANVHKAYKILLKLHANPTMQQEWLQKSITTAIPSSSSVQSQPQLQPQQQTQPFVRAEVPTPHLPNILNTSSDLITQASDQENLVSTQSTHFPPQQLAATVFTQPLHQARREPTNVYVKLTKPLKDAGKPIKVTTRPLDFVEPIERGEVNNAGKEVESREDVLESNTDENHQTSAPLTVPSTSSTGEFLETTTTNAAENEIGDDSAAFAEAEYNEERKERVYVEKSIDIPSTLVGLLLARRPDFVSTRGGRSSVPVAQKNVMNQIQVLTRTVISRTSGPKTYVRPTVAQLAEAVGPEVLATVLGGDAEGANRMLEKLSIIDAAGEGKVVDEKEEIEEVETEPDQDHEDGVEDVSQGTNEGDREVEFEHDDEHEFKDALGDTVEVLEGLTVNETHAEHDVHDHNSVPTGNEDSKVPTEDVTTHTDVFADLDEDAHVPGHLLPAEPVTFKVTGATEKVVDIAIEYLTKIVAGERIKDVMSALKERINTEYPPRFPFRGGMGGRRGLTVGRIGRGFGGRNSRLGEGSGVRSVRGGRSVGRESSRGWDGGRGDRLEREREPRSEREYRPRRLGDAEGGRDGGGRSASRKRPPAEMI